MNMRLRMSERLRMTERMRAIGACLLGVLAASHAWAQNVPGMNGRANDANNQVGSGGYNPASGPAYFNTANLYITGNVTRGAHFRGNSPIRDSNSLFLSLPSSAVADFERDSVGLSTALGSPTPWRATPYYHPARTAPPIGDVQAALNQSVPTAPSVSYLAPLPFQTTQPVSPNLDLTYGTRPLTSVLPDSSIYTPENSPELSGNGLYDRLRLTSQMQALQQSPIFGKTEIVTQPLTQQRQNAAGLGDPYSLERMASPLRPADPILRDSRTAPADTESPASRFGLGAPDLLDPAMMAPKLFDAPMMTEPIANAPVTAQPAEPTTVPLGESPLAMTDATSPRGLAVPTGQMDEEATAPTWSSAAVNMNPLIELGNAVAFIESLQGDAPQAEAPSTMPPSIREQYEQALSVVRDQSAQSVYTLAGKGPSRVDELMRAGEAKVREGDYYQASTLYGLAAAHDPSNPLVRLGYAHALAAAGEYVTAVRQLEQAIAAYPAFGYLRLDLNEFVREAKDLDLRRADLEVRLERNENYRLRFLLGYIEYYSGFEKFGVPDLQKAANAAPEGSVIARFPQILKSPEKYLGAAESDEAATP